MWWARVKTGAIFEVDCWPSCLSLFLWTHASLCVMQHWKIEDSQQPVYLWQRSTESASASKSLPNLSFLPLPFLNVNVRYSNVKARKKHGWCAKYAAKQQFPSFIQDWGCTRSVRCGLWMGKGGWTAGRGILPGSTKSVPLSVIGRIIWPKGGLTLGPVGHLSQDVTSSSDVWSDFSDP